MCAPTGLAGNGNICLSQTSIQTAKIRPHPPVLVGMDVGPPEILVHYIDVTSAAPLPPLQFSGRDFACDARLGDPLPEDIGRVVLQRVKGPPGLLALQHGRAVPGPGGPQTAPVAVIPDPLQIQPRAEGFQPPLGQLYVEQQQLPQRRHVLRHKLRARVLELLPVPVAVPPRRATGRPP